METIIGHLVLTVHHHFRVNVRLGHQVVFSA